MRLLTMTILLLACTAGVQAGLFGKDVILITQISGGNSTGGNNTCWPLSNSGWIINQTGNLDWNETKGNATYYPLSSNPANYLTGTASCATLSNSTHEGFLQNITSNLAQCYTIEKGSVGPQGPTGPQGPQGIPGTNGTNGVNGTNGIDGINGTNGINGTDGLNGSSITFTSIYSFGNGSFEWNFSDNTSYITPNLTGPIGPEGPSGSGGGNNYIPYQIKTDFIGLGTNSFPPFLGAATSSGGVGNPSFEIGYPGIVGLRDSTTANGGYRYTTGTTQSYFMGNESFIAVFNIRATSGFRAGVIGYYGFHDATTITQPVDGCYIRQIGGLLRGECRNNAGPTITATNFTATANNWYKMNITMNSAATSVTFTITNSTEDIEWTDTVAGNVPTTSSRIFGAGIGVWESTTDAGDYIVYLDYMEANFNNQVVFAR